MAQVPTAFPGVRPFLHDIVQFAARPTPPERQVPWGKALLAMLGVLLALDIALTMGVVALLTGAEALGYEPPPYVDLDLPTPVMWLLVVGLAPIAEEIVFRGWLSGRKGALVLAVVGFGGVAALILAETFAPSAADMVGLVALAAFGLALVYWLATLRKGQPMLPRFRQFYPLFVWLSSLVFGAVHLSNYEGTPEIVDILMVLPQTLGGLVIAFTRTRLGLRAAILHHALFNAIAFALEPFL